jgi:2-haloacid dehalogenase
MLDLTPFKVLTFDCYGTMIDWETGIFSALRPILAAHGKEISDYALLELYSELEASAEQGEFQRYRDVLQSVVRGFGERLRFSPTDAEVRSLPESLANWQPFPDTVEALRKLKSRYQLAVISNVDDDLFASTAPKLGVAFNHVITAQQARCYKPCMPIFELAEERIGVSREHWLHVGQSIYHDVIPAQSLGIATVWVNRPSPRPSAGAARAAFGKPDLEVSNLKTLADLAAATHARPETENREL